MTISMEHGVTGTTCTSEILGRETSVTQQFACRDVNDGRIFSLETTLLEF